MIVLFVILALTFLWACVATASAIVNDKLAKANQSLVDAQQDYVLALQDRIQATSLSEFHASRAIAMDPREPATRERYTYDETGLIRGIAEPDESEE